MISSNAGRNRSFWRSSRGLATASPNADDPPPNRKKSGPAAAISCKINYFTGRVLPAVSTVPRFFTDDAIGAGRGDGDRLTGGDRVERGGDIIMRRLDVGEAGRGLVVDRAHVDDTAVAVDDDHIRGRTSIIEAADNAVGVEQEIGRRGLPAREIGLSFDWGHIALLAGGRGGDRQSHDTCRDVFALQRLHVAALVILADERAAVIGPFEHNGLPRIVAKADDLAGNIGRAEPRRRMANCCRRGGRQRGRPLNGEGANRSECRYRRGLYRSTHTSLRRI